MSSQALALGLGEIRLDSALNEPLRAEIRLLSATPEELETLTVQMASAESFARYGLDRPAYLSSVRFRVVPSGRTDGNVIQLTSSQAFTEPFLTFLVEADWSSGRLLREYTVLLDPPTFAPPPSEPLTQSVEPPVRSQPADSGEIRRPAPVAEPAPARPAPAPTPVRSAESRPDAAESPAPVPFDDTPGGAYEVQRGDTLWNIAIRYRPDNRLTVNQMMLAIFEANPDAFDNNINRLSAGASLRIPSADEVFRITRADAFAEVQRQNEAWQGGRGVPSDTGVATSAPTDVQPSLELVPPDDDTLSADSSTVYDGPDLAEEPETRRGSLDDIRIAEIEDLIADEQAGLVVISDNELAALRRELAELRGEEIPADLLPGATETADDVFAADDAATGDEVFVDETDASAAAEDTMAADAMSPEPEAAAPAPAPRPVARQPQTSLVDTVLGYVTGIWGLVVLGVVLAAGAVLFLARRAARRGDDDDASGMWTALDDGDLAAAAGGGQTSRLGIMDRGDETIVVEEAAPAGGSAAAAGMTETMEIPPSMRAGADEEDVDPTAATGTNQALEDTFSSDTALNLDQSDPIAEADFHMAYGLYDQAADLVNGALAVDPNRTDLVAKLCEIYFVWGNRDAFVDAAERFKALLGNGEDPEWDKTVIMGQQIAGDHPLFSEGAGATKAVDLAFDDAGGGAELDMDFAAGDAGGDDVIDLGADEVAAGAANETNSALDFVFDEEESGGTGITEQMPAADPFEDAFADAKTAEMPAMEEPTAEMPTFESPLDDSTSRSPTIEDQLAEFEATGQMPALEDLEATGELPAIGDFDAGSNDATAEIDLDDLGLDLDTMRGEALLSDLDDTSESEVLDIDSLAATGRNEVLADADPTGRNQAIDGYDDSDSTDLLDATGHTQVLPDDFAVETGTGTNIEKALADDEATMLASLDDDSDGLAGDAETLVASLDDDDDVGDFDFARTEALPQDSFDPSVGVPGSTDMDLDLDDLTAALRMSTAGDTVDQPRDDATLEQPRPAPPGMDFDDSPTAAIGPDEMSEGLHDARTMTEVGTKLDLARAYVDMGDPGGARSILEEVLDEGDESQRQQAQQLLDSLPA
jgi:pilus assembly protein FimV